ncbi:MAG: T9SS type A sorting domain-containing protein [Bacteroidia bacterium]
MRLTLFFYLILLSHFAAAQENSAIHRFYSPIGEVNAMTRYQDTLYIAGKFEAIGRNIGSFYLSDKGTDQPDTIIQGLQGLMNCAIPDSQGGWYVGGLFRYYTPTYYISFALGRIDATGKLIDWAYAGSSPINAMVRAGNKIYYAINNILHAYDLNTKISSVFYSGLNGTVTTIKAKDSLLFIGGNFSNADYQASVGLCVLNLNTGQRIKGYPATNGGITDIEVINNNVIVAGAFSNTGLIQGAFSKLSGPGLTPEESLPYGYNNAYCAIPDESGGWYVGGNFYTTGITYRTTLVRFKADNSIDTIFKPNVYGDVRYLYLKDSCLYISGNFTQVNGISQSGISCINRYTGEIIPWHITINGLVSSFHANDSVIYLGGGFSYINNKRVSYLACVNRDSMAELRDLTFQVNGYVSSMIAQNNSLYLGGNFTSTGRFNPGLARLELSNPVTDFNFPGVNGIVKAIIPDGSGGYYIGGKFSSINNTTHHNIAHINNDFSIDNNFQADVTDTVYALTLANNTLYVAGAFDFVNSSTKKYLVALNKTTGAIQSGFNPDPNAPVHCLSYSSGILYFGGRFTTVFNQSRNYAAAAYTLTNQLSPWNPDLNFKVLDILKDNINGRVYLAGGFTTVNDTIVRNRLAAVNSFSGEVLPWNPNLNNYCNKIILHGSKLYAGGIFTSVNNTQRMRLAAIDTITAMPTAWNPAPDGEVLTICIGDSTLAAGGLFMTIAGQNNRHLAIFDLSGNIKPINPELDNHVHSLLYDNNTIITGGEFQFSQTQERKRLFSIDLLNKGIPTLFNPNLNSNVTQLVKSDKALYVCGFFTSIGTVSRNYVAAFDLNSGALLPFSPKLNGIPYCMALRKSNLILTGGFTKAELTISRKYIASYNLVTNTLNSWNMDISSNIFGASFSGNNLLLYGKDLTINSSRRNNLFAFDLTTQKVTNWNPGPDKICTALLNDNATLYVGGAFTSMRGNPRNCLAAFNTSTLSLKPWAPAVLTNDTVRDIAASNDTIYIAGTFENSISNHLLSIDPSGNAISSWNPNLNKDANCVNVQNNRVLCGGYFTHSNLIFRKNFCGINLTTGKPTELNIAFDNRVNTMQLQHDTIYLGGDFTHANTSLRSRLAAINISNYALLSWSPAADSSVNELVIKNQDLYAGGAFSTMNNTGRNGLATLNPKTGSLNSWNPNLNAGATIHAIYPHDTLVYIGGLFQSIGGIPIQHLAALQSNGTPLNWTPHPDSTVLDITGNASHLYVSGRFTSISSAARMNIASYDFTTSTLRNWDPLSYQGTSTSVHSISVLGDRVFIGGNFYYVNGSYGRSVAEVSDSNSINIYPWNPRQEGIIYHLLADSNYIFAAGKFTDQDTLFHHANLKVFDATGIPPVNLSTLRKANRPAQTGPAKNQTNFAAHSAFPNPAEGYIFIPALAGYTGSYTVYDVNGRTVYTGFLSGAANEQTKIDVSMLENGIYFLYPAGLPGNTAVKFIIERNNK